jgi:hypothetical protein
LYNPKFTLITINRQEYPSEPSHAILSKWIQDINDSDAEIGEYVSEEEMPYIEEEPSASSRVSLSALLNP